MQYHLENMVYIAVMADLEGAFDTVWREGAIYKLQKAEINNNLLSVFSSFLSDKYSRTSE